MLETEDRRTNLIQILLTAIITGIVGVATGMLLFHLQREKPHLTFEVKDTIPFVGDREKLAIYHITIRNGGKKVVSDVDCHISVAPALVKETRVSLEPSLSHTEQVADEDYKIHFKNLNPHEEVTVSVLAASQGELPSRPKISLRGQGIAGEEAPQKEKKSFWEGPMFPAIVSAYSVFLVFYVMLRFRLRRIVSSVLKPLGLDDRPIHSDNQNEILAYLFGLRGLIAEAEKYLDRSQDSSYWSEADRIGALAVQSADASETELRKQVLLDLLRYASIAPRSEAIIHYNIARIAKFQKRDEECKVHLKKARESIPKLLSTRLSLDPLFAAKIEESS